MRVNAIYVETTIQTDLDTLWERTQNPALHVRWDGRFSRIEPIATDNGEPSRFRYAVRIAPRIEIGGIGSHQGDRVTSSGATSSLSFASEHPLSLLRTGAGYWRYHAGDRGIEFSTGYDYKVRWGRVGKAADRVWRPLMARLTAWSFDRLRLWVEADVAPEITLATTVVSVSALIASIVLAVQAHPAAVLPTALWIALRRVTPRASRCTYGPRPFTRHHATPTVVR